MSCFSDIWIYMYYFHMWCISYESVSDLDICNSSSSLCYICTKCCIPYSLTICNDKSLIETFMYRPFLFISFSPSFPLKSLKWYMLFLPQSSFNPRSNPVRLVRLRNNCYLTITQWISWLTDLSKCFFGQSNKTWIMLLEKTILVCNCNMYEWWRSHLKFCVSNDLSVKGRLTCCTQES